MGVQGEWSCHRGDCNLQTGKLRVLKSMRACQGCTRWQRVSKEARKAAWVSESPTSPSARA